METPMSCTLRRSKSGNRRENSTNSVVHTGVKSAGCENSSTHFPFAVTSLSRSIPCVVLASKSGAGSLMRGKRVVSITSSFLLRLRLRDGGATERGRQCFREDLEYAAGFHSVNRRADARAPLPICPARRVHRQAA